MTPTTSPPRVRTPEELGRAVLSGVVDVDVHVQPIVDVKRSTVVGHEALSRFPDHGPEPVFLAADAAGFGPELQLRAIEAVLRRRTSLPASTFLTVNASPDALQTRAMLDLFRAAAPLQGLVVEITEHERIDVERLASSVGVLRKLGALVAVDDVGSGYAGLQAVLGLRPDLLKIDRSLVSGMDTDPVKQETVRMLGELASRLDAWILVEGVETQGELDEAARLGVPLAQGWLLGRPGPAWQAAVPDDVATAVALVVQAQAASETVAALVRPCRIADLDEVVHDDGRALVRVDEDGRPVLLQPPVGLGPEDHAPMVVQLDEGIHALAARLAVESSRLRCCVVVTNPDGTVAGVVAVQSLLGVLAAG